MSYFTVAITKFEDDNTGVGRTWVDVDEDSAEAITRALGQPTDETFWTPADIDAAAHLVDGLLVTRAEDLNADG